MQHVLKEAIIPDCLHPDNTYVQSLYYSSNIVLEYGSNGLDLICAEGFKLCFTLPLPFGDLAANLWLKFQKHLILEALFQIQYI